MKMVFEDKQIPCLERILQEVQSGELTQEIRVPDGLPDIGRILAVWGQVILRGKEWRSDCILLSGGMMTWVLYTPEDGTEPRSLDTWIPFQMKWQLPEHKAEGAFQVSAMPRFVDARSVSPRKIMVRAGVSAQADAYVPMTASVSQPEGAPEGVEILRSAYPVRLPREAGEKEFFLDEEIDLPANKPDKLLYFCVKPEISDQRVLSNKAAFRGNANLHILFLGKNGRVCAEDYPLPFSQFAELKDLYGSDGQVSSRMAVTNLELEMLAEEKLRVKCGLTVQYLAEDITVLETASDAYSPGRTMKMECSSLILPAILEKRMDMVYADCPPVEELTELADSTVLMDFPRQFRENDGITLEIPGSRQVLYYDRGDQLCSVVSRWEARKEIPSDASVTLTAQPVLRTENVSSQNTVIEIPLRMTVSGGQGIPMVTALDLGEETEPDAQRPSLILRRAGSATLWEIARSCGSTVDAIRKANGLTEEPSPGRMLLIPVC